MPKVPITFTPDALATLRRRFEEGSESRRALASEFDRSVAWLYQLAERHGWARREAPRRPAGASRASGGVAITKKRTTRKKARARRRRIATASSGSIACRLERAVMVELAALEQAQSRATTEDADRHVRTLERLTDTLGKVRRLHDPTSEARPDDDDMPGDLEQFRRELARRIEQFVRSRGDARLPERHDGRDGEAAS